jgi:hypothetical protein
MRSLFRWVALPCCVLNVLITVTLLVLFALSWHRGGMLPWAPFAGERTSDTVATSTESNLLRLEVTVPRDCQFGCNLHGDRFEVVLEPKRVHLVVQREPPHATAQVTARRTDE